MTDSESATSTVTRRRERVPSEGENPAQEDLIHLWEVAQALHDSDPDRTPPPESTVELALVVGEILDGRDTDEIEADLIKSRLSEEALSGLEGRGMVTRPVTDGSILRIESQVDRKLGDDGVEWVRKGDHLYDLGPVGETAYQYCSDNLSGTPTDWAKAVQTLVQTGDVGPLDNLKAVGPTGNGDGPEDRSWPLGPSGEVASDDGPSTSDSGKDDRLTGNAKHPHPPLHQGLRDTAPPMDLRSGTLEGVVEDGQNPENQPSAAAGGDFEGTDQSEESEVDDLHSGRLSGKKADSWEWKPQFLRRATCDHGTREAIFEHVPEAENDETVFRYVVFVLWTTFHDEYTNLKVLPNEALLWIGDGEFDTGVEVISHLQKFVGLDFEAHIPKRRCRLIRKDGLPHELYRVRNRDVSTPPSEYDNRVYVLSGRAFNRMNFSKDRDEIQEALRSERHNAPSLQAQKTFELLNFGGGADLRTSRTTNGMTDHLDEAFEHVRRMEIDVEVSRKSGESKAQFEQRRRRIREEQRHQYFITLSAIEDQHQPLYGFSGSGRTDRVFGYVRGVLDLPSAVRRILCQDWVEVDLRSAHLLIAAWLWDAGWVLKKIQDEDYSIWDDLMEHMAPLFNEAGYEVPEKGDDLYQKVKSATKVAVYSTVYGMPAPSIQAKVTKTLKDILGPEVGAYVRSHPVIEQLLRKRDEKLSEMEVGDVIHGPTGIEIEIDQGLDESGDGVDPKSAMATLCQSYEQSAMQVILELEADRDASSTRNRFKVALWLHDGAYVKMKQSRARTKDLNQRLQDRCEELAEFAGKEDPLPAFFEVEDIDPPKLPTRPCKTTTSNPTSSTSPSTKSRTETTTILGHSVESVETVSRAASTSPASAPLTKTVGGGPSSDQSNNCVADPEDPTESHTIFWNSELELGGFTKGHLSSIEVRIHRRPISTSGVGPGSSIRWPGPGLGARSRHFSPPNQQFL